MTKRGPYLTKKRRSALEKRYEKQSKTLHYIWCYQVEMDCYLNNKDYLAAQSSYLGIIGLLKQLDWSLFE